MSTPYKYIVVGGGLAGASAVDGIRELDPDGTILLLCKEKHLPYNRPPLTKQLWSGKKKIPDIFVHDEKFYRDRKVEVLLDTEAVALNVRQRHLTDSKGDRHGFNKLLLATGCKPRHLSLPGGDLPDVCYFRTLDDFTRIHEMAEKKNTAAVIGGGFIGSEMAAALTLIGKQVTMLFPGPFLANKVLPESVARFVQEDYRKRGVTVVSNDHPDTIRREKSGFLIRTRTEHEIKADLVIVGVGVVPDVSMAEIAGLKQDDGIVVNEFLQSSDPDIYAAGDNASFPYRVLGRQMRIEHWDNAQAQGKHAGRNMAAAGEAFTYMPYFFSDLFDFGYEAVGEVDTRLETRADWQEENTKGTIYYLREGKIRGALMCNVWDKVDAARDAIRRGATVEELTGKAIR